MENTKASISSDNDTAWRRGAGAEVDSAASGLSTSADHESMMEVGDGLYDYFYDFGHDAVKRNLSIFQKSAEPYMFGVGLVVNALMLLILVRRKVRQQHHSCAYFIALITTQTTLLVLLLISHFWVHEPDLVCKLGAFLLHIFFRAHDVIICALTVDRAAEYVSCLSVETGSSTPPACSSKLTLRIQKVAAHTCSRSGATKVIVAIFTLVFIDNTWVWWTYSHMSTQGYCSFNVHHNHELFSWFIGIASARILLICLVNLIASGILVYLLIKGKLPNGSGRTQDSSTIPRKSLTTLVLCIATMNVAYKTAVVINNINFQVNLSGDFNHHLFVMVILHIVNMFLVPLVPILCFVFLSPASMEEVRYMCWAMCNRLRYCSGSRESFVRHRNEADDEDQLVSAENTLQVI